VVFWQRAGKGRSFATASGDNPVNQKPSSEQLPKRSLFDQISPEMRPWLWQGKIQPAFWTVASLLSLAINVILIVVLILVGKEIFLLKSLVSEQLVGGLHQNFVQMDQAHIRTTIPVNDIIQVKDTIPVVFDLPLNQSTTVVLTEDAKVKNTTIYLNRQPVPLDLILRKGTELDIGLNLTVPVSQTVPVVLNVPVALNIPVDIPLNQTELHEPFVGLQSVVAPYDQLLSKTPSSWEDTPLCSPPFDWFCILLKN
jgi:hypothetical protein